MNYQVDAFTQGFIDGVTNRPPEQQEAIARGLQFVAALLGTIREAGPQGAPEGPMYAAAMAAGFSLDAFESALALLAKRGLIRRSGHVAYYVPPPNKTEACSSSTSPVRS